MKVTISKDAMCGTTEVPAGEYLVALATDSGQFTLTGGGRTVKLPATRRRTAAKSKITSVSFFNGGGGTTWSLLFTGPKVGEWVAMLEIDGKKKKA